MDDHAGSVALVMRAALPHLRRSARGGAIVVVSSVQALATQAGTSRLVAERGRAPPLGRVADPAEVAEVACFLAGLAVSLPGDDRG